MNILFVFLVLEVHEKSGHPRQSASIFLMPVHQICGIFHISLLKISPRILRNLLPKNEFLKKFHVEKSVLYDATIIHG